MVIIDYTATGANRLKNWELMVKPTDEKLVYNKKESNFWTFQEVFSTHVHNMGWNEAMKFKVNGVDKDLTFQFGEIDMSTIANEWTILKGKTNPSADDEKRKLQLSAMYTWLLNSMDKDFKKFLTQNATKHERQGPLAWKMITEHSVKSDRQAIRRAMCKMHTLTLEQFDFDVNKLVDEVIENKAILESCGETDNSIASNLFRILGSAPCDEFKTWMLSHQNVYDDGGAFDLENFLTTCKNKYNNYVADGLWRSSKKTKKEIEKESEIVALNSRFDNLEKLLLAQKSEGTGNAKGTGNGGKSSWKLVAPKTGEPWTIEKNGRTWNWCKHHKYWTAKHNSDDCRKGKEMEANTGGTQGGATNPSLAINMAELDDEEIFLAKFDTNIHGSFDEDLDELVCRKPNLCKPCNKDVDSEEVKPLN